ncbi:MAG: DJ-1/PfpI family protein [Pseudomonadota bacterium]
MHIAILLFDDLTVLDAAGPAEVLGRLPGARVSFVAKQAGPVSSQEGSSGLKLIADAGFDQVPRTDVLLVPGGPGYATAANDPATLAWLRSLAAEAAWVTSVCTGALVLGAAGLLQGKRATTHWSMIDALADHGAVPERARFVRDGQVVTGAGVSAGIDMALTLAALIAGPERAQAIQLQIEYAPEPPFDAGTLGTAPETVKRLLGVS